MRRDYMHARGYHTIIQCSTMVQHTQQHERLYVNVPVNPYTLSSDNRIGLS